MLRLSYLYFETRRRRLAGGDSQAGTNTVRNNQLELFSKS